MEKSSRFEFIHLLRGFAPLLVVWAHLADWWPNRNGIHWVGQDIWLEWVVRPLQLSQFGGHLGVVVFFLISGFVITHVSLRETREAFAARRVYRLAPVLFIATVLTVLAARFTNWMGSPPMIGVGATSSVDVLLNVTLLSWFVGTPWVLSVTWTLLIEVVFYCIVLVVIPISGKAPVRATVVMLLLSIAVIVPVQLLSDDSAQYLDRIIYLPFLICGRCLYFMRDRFSWRWVSLAGISLLLFGAFHVMRFGDGLWASKYPPVATYGIALAMFIGCMYAPLNRTPQPFRWLGDISYSLYLLHLPVGATILAVATKFGLPFAPAFILAIGVSCLVSTASYKLVEVPFQSLGRRRARPGQIGLNLYAEMRKPKA
jgi:peptidoglycan/LPS O-acetylase OafA/YrhL